MLKQQKSLSVTMDADLLEGSFGSKCAEDMTVSFSLAPSPSALIWCQRPVWGLRPERLLICVCLCVGRPEIYTKGLPVLSPYNLNNFSQSNSWPDKSVSLTLSCSNRWGEKNPVTGFGWHLTAVIRFYLSTCLLNRPKKPLRSFLTDEQNPFLHFQWTELFFD